MGSEQKAFVWWDGIELLHKSPNNGEFHLIVKKK